MSRLKGVGGGGGGGGGVRQQQNTSLLECSTAWSVKNLSV